MISVERCDRCRFWSKTNGYEQGECRARPPLQDESIPGDALRRRGSWPFTLADEWCGAFREDRELAKRRLEEHDNWERGAG